MLRTATGGDERRCNRCGMASSTLALARRPKGSPADRLTEHKQDVDARFVAPSAPSRNNACTANPTQLMVNRREFLGVTLGAGATLGLTPELLRAIQQQGGKLIQRAIPSTGEMLPVIGLSFSNHAACANPA